MILRVKTLGFSPLTNRSLTVLEIEDRYPAAFPFLAFFDAACILGMRIVRISKSYTCAYLLNRDRNTQLVYTGKIRSRGKGRRYVSDEQNTADEPVLRYYGPAPFA